MISLRKKQVVLLVLVLLTISAGFRVLGFLYSPAFKVTTCSVSEGSLDFSTPVKKAPDVKIPDSGLSFENVPSLLSIFTPPSGEYFSLAKKLPEIPSYLKNLFLLTSFSNAP